jgi:hypothetical protein
MYYTEKFICLCGLVVSVPGWLQIQRSQVPIPGAIRFAEQQWVGLEQGPLSIVRITEELLEWKSSGLGSKIEINSGGDPLRLPRNALYLQNLALTSTTSSGHSLGVVCL